MIDQLGKGLLLSLQKELIKPMKRATHTSRPTDSDEETSDDSVIHSSSSSKRLHQLIKSLQKSLYDLIPKYDGEGDIQRLLEFTDKVESYLEIAELIPTLEITAITAKLTGTANLIWQHHKKMYNSESTNCIKNWKGLRDLLFKNKMTEEHERSVLTHIESIQQ